MAKATGDVMYCRDRPGQPWNPTGRSLVFSCHRIWDIMVIWLSSGVYVHIYIHHVISYVYIYIYYNHIFIYNETWFYDRCVWSGLSPRKLSIDWCLPSGNGESFWSGNQQKLGRNWWIFHVHITYWKLKRLFEENGKGWAVAWFLRNQATSDSMGSPTYDGDTFQGMICPISQHGKIRDHDVY